MGTATSQWNFDIPQNLLDAADRLDGEPTLQFEVDDDEDDDAFALRQLKTPPTVSKEIEAPAAFDQPVTTSSPPAAAQVLDDSVLPGKVHWSDEPSSPLPDFAQPSSPLSDPARPGSPFSDAGTVAPLDTKEVAADPETQVEAEVDHDSDAGSEVSSASHEPASPSSPRPLDEDFHHYSPESKEAWRAEPIASPQSSRAHLDSPVNSLPSPSTPALTSARTDELGYDWLVTPIAPPSSSPKSPQRRMSHKKVGNTPHFSHGSASTRVNIAFDGDDVFNSAAVQQAFATTSKSKDKGKGKEREFSIPDSPRQSTSRWDSPRKQTNVPAKEEADNLYATSRSLPLKRTNVVQVGQPSTPPNHITPPVPMGSPATNRTRSSHRLTDSLELAGPPNSIAEVTGTDASSVRSGATATPRAIPPVIGERSDSNSTIRGVKSPLDDGHDRGVTHQVPQIQPVPVVEATRPSAMKVSTEPIHAAKGPGSSSTRVRVTDYATISPSVSTPQVQSPPQSTTTSRPRPPRSSHKPHTPSIVSPITPSTNAVGSSHTVFRIVPPKATPSAPRLTSPSTPRKGTAHQWPIVDDRDLTTRVPSSRSGRTRGLGHAKGLIPPITVAKSGGSAESGVDTPLSPASSALAGIPTGYDSGYKSPSPERAARGAKGRTGVDSSASLVSPMDNEGMTEDLDDRTDAGTYITDYVSDRGLRTDRMEIMT